MKNSNTFRKSFLLLWVLNLIHDQRSKNSALLLGSLNNSEKETAKPIHPLRKRDYDRAEAHARKVLGNEAFEIAFGEGQKLSLDEALDLALKTIDEL